MKLEGVKGGVKRKGTKIFFWGGGGGGGGEETKILYFALLLVTRAKYRIFVSFFLFSKP